MATFINLILNLKNKEAQIVTGWADKASSGCQQAIMASGQLARFF
jgi:hypothetical protein